MNICELVPFTSADAGSRCDSLMELHKMRPRRKPQPFRVPASTYYFLSAGVAIAVFFLVWAILNDAKEESPWISSGIVASATLIAAGAARELVIRSIRERRLLEQRRLDRALLSVPIVRPDTNPDKLTLQRSAAFLNEIQRKSDAAKVLSSIPASHREVFYLCDEYVRLVDKELPTVNVGSPRLGHFIKGRDLAVRFHRYHMLKWAEGEAVAFARSTAPLNDPARRLEAATATLSAIESAAAHYPEERILDESGRAVKEIMASLRVRVLIDRARNAKLEGSREQVRSLIDEAETAVRKASELGYGPNAVLDALNEEIELLRTRGTEDLSITDV